LLQKSPLYHLHLHCFCHQDVKNPHAHSTPMRLGGFKPELNLRSSWCTDVWNSCRNGRLESQSCNCLEFIFCLLAMDENFMCLLNYYDNFLIDKWQNLKINSLKTLLQLHHWEMLVYLLKGKT
jgi:hypothetical protein